jgi:hypothetical protein
MKMACRAGIVVALCLALWPALAGAAPPKPKGALVYADEFSDPKTSGLEDNLAAKDYGRGFHPGVYILNLHKSNDTHWVLLPKLAFGEFTLEMDLWDDSDSFQGSAAQGVVFRAMDASHLYAVLIDPRGGKYTVRKLDGPDNWSDLVASTSSPLIKHKSDINHLRVDGEGSKFTIYLNGEALASFSDTAYAKGGYGMIASNGEANETLMHFDNVNIYTTEAQPTGQMQPAGQSQSGGQMQMQPSSLPVTGEAGNVIPLLALGCALAFLVLGAWTRQRR